MIVSVQARRPAVFFAHRRARGHHVQARQRRPTRTFAEDDGATFSLAPAKPTTPFGEMLAYYLEMEPALFQSAVEDQYERIKAERDEALAASTSESEGDPPPSATSSTDLVLSGLSERMQAVAEKERRATVEDLMYMSILEEFIKLGIGMLPKMDNYTSLDAVTLNPLMDGVHTKEALDLVREHMMSLLGQTAMLPPTATLKMSKLQMLQVYGASVMFGYFLRRADNRFQLARSMGMLPEDKDDAVARLERLFSLGEDGTAVESMDSAEPQPASPDSTASSSSSPSESSGTSEPVLRKYIKSFDEQTMRETASLMSKESASLLDRQTKALWGDVQKLQEEMQKAIGVDVSSLEEVMKRAEKAVSEDAVDTVTMNISTQRRAVLEAVAFGTFLRDVESHVDTTYGLLTPLPTQGGPGMLPA